MWTVTPHTLDTALSTAQDRMMRGNNCLSSLRYHNSIDKGKFLGLLIVKFSLAVSWWKLLHGYFLRRRHVVHLLAWYKHRVSKYFQLFYMPWIMRISYGLVTSEINWDRLPLWSPNIKFMNSHHDWTLTFFEDMATSNHGDSEGAQRSNNSMDSQLEL